MKRIILTKILPLLAVLVAVLGHFAQAGAASEALEFLIKRISNKSGSAAAEALVKEAVDKSPVVARLVRQYGDDALVTLAGKPGRVELVEKLGDDAAEALLKHADIAENALRQCPDGEVASALGAMSRESGQYLSICSSRNALSAQDYKTLILVVREGGEAAAEKLSRMSPSALDKVLKTAQTAGLAAAVTMVAATAAISDSPAELVENIFSLFQWIYEHPIPVLLVFVILVSLVIKFPDIVVNILRWLPRAAWRVLKRIWHAFRKN